MVVIGVIAIAIIEAILIIQVKIILMMGG